MSGTVGGEEIASRRDVLHATVATLPKLHTRTPPMLDCKVARKAAFLGLIAASTVLASGCSAAGAAEEVEPLPPIMVLDAAAAAEELTLLPVDSLVVGIADSVRISRVTHFLPTSDRILVVDGATDRVLGFNYDGEFIRQVGKSGMGLDEYEDPYRVGVRGDSTFVLDLARFSHVLAYDSSGAYIGGVDWRNERMPTDMQLTASGMVVSTTVMPEKGTGMTALHVLGPGGAPRGRGCRADPRVVLSDSGMMGALVFAGLQVRNGRIYCSQNTTPVVQVTDTTGAALPPITIAPPFYVGPVDRPLTMNTKQMLAFNASFTTHVSFVPTDAGFVSTYSQYDTTMQQNRYLLFACDSTQGARRCGTLETNRRVLHVAAPDTLYLQEQGGDGALVVGRYRLLMDNGR